MTQKIPNCIFTIDLLKIIYTEIQTEAMRYWLILTRSSHMHSMAESVWMFDVRRSWGGIRRILAKHLLKSFKKTQNKPISPQFLLEMIIFGTISYILWYLLYCICISILYLVAGRLRIFVFFVINEFTIVPRFYIAIEPARQPASPNQPAEPAPTKPELIFQNTMPKISAI